MERLRPGQLEAQCHLQKDRGDQNANDGKGGEVNETGRSVKIELSKERTTSAENTTANQVTLLSQEMRERRALK